MKDSLAKKMLLHELSCVSSSTGSITHTLVLSHEYPRLTIHWQVKNQIHVHTAGDQYTRTSNGA